MPFAFRASTYAHQVQIAWDTVAVKMETFETVFDVGKQLKHTHSHGSTEKQI